MTLPRPLTHLGRLPVAQFMRRHWQRRPLLVRGALPAMPSPVDRATLFALARRAEVQSRLVTAADGRWQLKHGPLARLPSPARPGWTVLVQGLEAWVPAAAELLARFRFIADARLDDLMASYASDGGGVGPHVDSYDVFLIQVQGRRRWRIGRQRDVAEVPGLPLKILADFRPTEEWVLDPGDLLYLPPNVAHEGTAVGGDCITCSVGFRAPTPGDLAERWLDDLARQPGWRANLTDPGMPPTRRPGALPPALIDQAWRKLRGLRPTAADTRQLLLAALSEPKADVVFAARRLTPARYSTLIRRHGVRLDPRTRLLYAGDRFGINGEVHRAASGAATVLRALADRRMLEAEQCRGLSPGALDLLGQWLQAGWIGPC
ncbi:MAG: JmjC domain-containing protein [Betaproteobacteria bacterium]